MIDNNQKTGVIGRTPVLPRRSRRTRSRRRADCHDRPERIQVSGGATADVKDNDVSANQYSPATVVSTGVLLFRPRHGEPRAHTVWNNDVNIYDFQSTGDVKIKSNEVSAPRSTGSTWSVLGATVETTIARQHVRRHLCERHSGRKPLRAMISSRTGRTESSSRMPTTTPCARTRRGRTGETWSTRGHRLPGNTIQNNDAKSNTTFDCHDESTGAGTAAPEHLDQRSR